MPVWASFNNLHTSVWVGSSCDSLARRLSLDVSEPSSVHCVLLGRLNLLLSFFSSANVNHVSVPLQKLFWNSKFWPQIRQDYPLNLSILISGGKETNKDSPSNGEWSGTSSNLKSVLLATPNCSLEIRFQGECAVLKLLGTAHRRGWQSRTWYCASFTMRFLWVGLLGNAAQNWR